MGDELAPFLGGSVLEALSVDKAGTRAREDSIKINVYGNIVHIDIACLAPPEEISPSLIIRTLNQELREPSKKPHEFLNQITRVKHGLAKDLAKEALVARYLFDKEKKYLLSEELSISKTVVTPTTMEHYGEMEACDQTLTYLLMLLDHKPKEKRAYSRKHGSTWGKGDYMVTAAMQLFNSTCRAAARREQIFFMERPRESEGRYHFKIYGDDAIFNRVLRDATAFVNASNLSRFLMDKPPIYTQQMLMENLFPGTLLST